MNKLSGETLEIIYTTLQYYGNLCTYQGERIGGVLKGCPRSPRPTPDTLIRPAQKALDLLKKEIRG